MNKKVLLIILLVVLLIGGYLLFPQKVDNKKKGAPIEKPPETKIDEQESLEVDYKASFAVFTHGTFRIFTASMYHNLSDEVYIESSSPNIVNVKKSDITWGEFFDTLPVVLTEKCLTTGTGQTFCDGQNGELRFFINGKFTPNALSTIINNSDQLLVTFGNESDEETRNQISQLEKIKIN